MKKRFMLFLAVVICFSLSACVEDKAAVQPTESVAVSTVEGPEAGEIPEVSEPMEDTTEDKAPVITVGDSSMTNICEFSIEYINITNDVMPPQPGDWYSHYEADKGKVYVDICVAYKNTDTSEVTADETISGILLYDGTYEYTGFSIIEEDNRTDLNYSNITSIAPLSTEYVHYLFEVPEEIKDTGAEIVLKMNIGGSDYKIIAREGNGTATVQDKSETWKTSGEVAIGEVVVTKNSEFNIDYADIVNSVVPPQPGDWYSYYEAEEGKVYVDICFAYKNTNSQNVEADSVISAELKYADKYEYTGFSIIEEGSRADFTYSNITSIAPLSTEYVHYLFEVPQEVQTSGESIEVTFTVDGNTYTYKVR